MESASSSSSCSKLKEFIHLSEHYSAVISVIVDPAAVDLACGSRTVARKRDIQQVAHEIAAMDRVARHHEATAIVAIAQGPDQNGRPGRQMQILDFFQQRLPATRNSRRRPLAIFRFILLGATFSQPLAVRFRQSRTEFTGAVRALTSSLERGSPLVDLRFSTAMLRRAQQTRIDSCWPCQFRASS